MKTKRLFGAFSLMILCCCMGCTHGQTETEPPIDSTVV